jgi:DNA-binding winged helix-turn-helix (wHTH) protein
LERKGQVVRLQPKVMQVLLTLADSAGEPVSKEHIFARVWPGTFVSDEVLTHSISELRRTFQDNPRDPIYIQTISKGGYRLVAPLTQLVVDSRIKPHFLQRRRWVELLWAWLLLLLH